MSDETNFLENDNEDILGMLKNGVATVDVTPEATAITVYVEETDTEEVKVVKENIEFIVNSARDAVSFLLQLGKQTGNPRFFETVNSLLNTINSSSNTLMNIDRKKNKDNEKSSDGTDGAKSITQINNDNRTIVMSTDEALALAAKNNKMKVIDG